MRIYLKNVKKTVKKTEKGEIMDIALRIDLKTNKYYFQDKNGVRREPDYDYARPFVEGFAAVKTNGKWFFLD